MCTLYVCSFLSFIVYFFYHSRQKTIKLLYFWTSFTSFFLFCLLESTAGWYVGHCSWVGSWWKLIIEALQAPGYSSASPLECTVITACGARWFLSACGFMCECVSVIDGIYVTCVVARIIVKMYGWSLKMGLVIWIIIPRHLLKFLMIWAGEVVLMVHQSTF